ncbi:undecaprenyl-diphosphatase [Pantoea sp.]|uniref:undecaprenyl-diphosphatase n=1 Tax=Pantoea sp. TaxID=69393 RepID=UPI0031D8875C
MFLTSETAENINDTLFLLINAPAHASHLLLGFGNLCASGLIFLYPLMLLIYWFSFNNTKQKIALQALLASLLALSANMVIAHFFTHPRPFMVPIGHTFISHAADSSFPSDHMTLACAIAISFIFSKKNVAGMSLLLLALFIGWGRVYLGVHFPGDILGSLLVATFCGWMVKKSENIFDPLFGKLYRLNDWLFGSLKRSNVKS